MPLASIDKPTKQRPVVWEPIPGTSQEFAIDTRAHHTLFTGSRGPGKSDTQLMRFKRRVGVGYGAFWRGIIFDREYKHLDDLVTKSKRWFNAFGDGAFWHGSTVDYKWTWPTGEELLFRVISKLDDYNNYHGHEYPYIGWNELTKYPNPDLYDMMMSCNRSSFTAEKDAPLDKSGKRIFIPPIPLEVFSTCNSSGPGHNWVKSRFIDVAPYGKLVTTTTKVFNPATKKDEDVKRTQVAIFGSWKENIYLSAEYIAGMMNMRDAALRSAWIDGNWDVISGGALDDIWNRAVHIIPRMQVPLSFRLNRSFDWGSTQPFSVGWWAQANGEEMTLPDGSKWAPYKGSLIQLAEWYGSDSIGSNIGVKLGSEKIAEGIKEREKQLLLDEWVLRQPYAGPADNQIRHVVDKSGETIETLMSQKGIRWLPSDKSPGSRIIGLELLRSRLENALTGEGPAIYFMDNCRASIATIPVLPRDDEKKDDIDTEAEDHAYDMMRYRIMQSRHTLPMKVKTTWVN